MIARSPRTLTVERQIMSEKREHDFPLGVPGFNFGDLFEPGRLARLLDGFDEALAHADPTLFAAYRAYRDDRGASLNPVEVSELLVRTAPHVGRFLARLFGIEDRRERALARADREFGSIFRFRHEVLERVAKRYDAPALASWDVDALAKDVDALRRAAFDEVAADPDVERATCRLGVRLWSLASEPTGSTEELDGLRRRLRADATAAQRFAELLGAPDEVLAHALLGRIEQWTYAAIHDPRLQPTVAGWMAFKTAERVNFSQLVRFETQPEKEHVSLIAPPSRRRLREGFGLTDPRFDPREVAFEVDHCIYCHDRDRDSCSKGMRKKDGTLRENPLGVTLAGCPLEEKISEAHLLKRSGDDLAALALIMIDNPMVPGTGHRICNDCMKGCIYQKVEPVNIPQIETNILTEVLAMPYGFEIFGLLTRWNPLNVQRPHALAYNGKNVLVVGLGPAGYTLSHYLLNEGFAVVAVDAFKLEPLPPDLVGSERRLPRPVRDIDELYEPLDSRVMAGFGGVAEYGITVRWDKNFLKVIYLTLLRRRAFGGYGGVRFGGTLTIDDAWTLGFDHIAIASGAGKPTIIELKNNLIRGVRKASDFLMALQLTGAAKRSSLANLQVRLPAGVIGGGLTAIDTATELLAYYPMQVEKVRRRYERLSAELGEAAVRSRFDAEERAILDEFLEHGRAVQAERDRARTEGRAPDLQSLVQAWGGVTLFYRKGLVDSPAYRQNHEEVAKGLEEGIAYAPGMNPLEAIADEFGHLCAVKFDRLEEGSWTSSGEQPVLPMRSLLVAAGTSPNTIYESEHPGTFELDGKFFQRFEPTWNAKPHLVPMRDTPVAKVAKPAPFTSYVHQGRHISFFGDNHPVYAGNVVKAMASAKHGYPYIVKLFESELRALDPQRQDKRDTKLAGFMAHLDHELIATVVEVNRLTPTIVEVVARAPMQARKFHPGQFYRIQNLESEAPTIEGTSLVAEGLALTGAWVHKDDGLISLITLEMGTSSKLCAFWKPGQEIVVMGPTGTPTEVPSHKTVLLAGGGLGNAVLFSIGKAMRERGCRVIYFAGYRVPGDVFKVHDIEAASDVVVWAVDPEPGVQPIPTTRPQDKTFVGNIVQAMTEYAKGELGSIPIPLEEVDEIMVIGSDRMMSAVKEARSGVLKPFLKRDHVAIGSINSSMQCMMKGICAQCLCKHVDPESGKESFVYSCFNQDQLLDRVDFENLHARLRQNSVQEKLSDIWLDYLLARADGALPPGGIVSSRR